MQIYEVVFWNNRIRTIQPWIRSNRSHSHLSRSKNHRSANGWDLRVLRGVWAWSGGPNPRRQQGLPWNGRYVLVLSSWSVPSFQSLPLPSSAASASHCKFNNSTSSFNFQVFYFLFIYIYILFIYYYFFHSLGFLLNQFAVGFISFWSVCICDRWVLHKLLAKRWIRFLVKGSAARTRGMLKEWFSTIEKWRN